MRIVKHLFFVIVPGGFGFRTGRYLLGAVFFCVWVLLVQAWIFISLTQPATLAPWLEKTVPAMALVLYGAGFALSAWVAAALRMRQGSDEDVLYSEAMKAFVAGDFDAANAMVRRILKTGALDCDCIFIQAHVALRQGRKRRAKRLFRKCRDFDEEGKWVWETERALLRLASAPGPLDRAD